MHLEPPSRPPQSLMVPSTVVDPILIITVRPNKERYPGSDIGTATPIELSVTAAPVAVVPLLYAEAVPELHPPSSPGSDGDGAGVGDGVGVGFDRN